MDFVCKSCGAPDPTVDRLYQVARLLEHLDDNGTPYETIRAMRTGLMELLMPSFAEPTLNIMDDGNPIPDDDCPHGKLRACVEGCWTEYLQTHHLENVSDGS